MIISRIGRSPTGSSGFGIEKVRGRKRVPCPPTKTTAFMLCSNPVCLRIVHSGIPSDPLDSMRQPLVQANLGSPRGNIPCLRVVAEQPVDLARIASLALRNLAHG